ncbi:AraC family transcriptional regulator [Domibacillus sp. DTU_2020_1001157_1_SI_ALB_TIR_016]|uniref:AraC family transcriptional regulator n=1 Tax=Domibacillus sp. DTU_2020_1001157_1_SI_ALB_TIR_016 TaxID=3077789 RepID=UPI0028ED0AD2|nr:AraC family transcriptional regulator [Domibacillus sp. DTU_2020_1001157_1_SI_ALB_TIR_016]WNS78640.1 AraC family transcriptional regulator [Domibacillus sp. DTU_2020_1001157_1_SI_ALB_TIR_016]
MEYSYELIKLHKNLPLKIIIHTSDNQAFISRHWHDSVEISYVLSGKIDNIYIDGKEYESGEGDIVVINSNAIHSFSVNRGQNRKAVTLLIPNEFLKAIFPDSDQVEFDCISIGEQARQKKRQFDELRKNLNAIINAYREFEKNSLAYIKVTSLTYELVYLLLKHFKIKKKSNSRIEARKYTERLAMITNFIQENYKHNLSLDILSSQFNLSPEYLSRFFMRYTGMTVLNYINAIRLEKSFPELMNTDHPIIQIALNHGFPNEKSYNRVFKAAYNITAYQYRKEQKRNRS